MGGIINRRRGFLEPRVAGWCISSVSLAFHGSCISSIGIFRAGLFDFEHGLHLFARALRCCLCRAVVFFWRLLFILSLFFWHLAMCTPRHTMHSGHDWCIIPCILHVTLGGTYGMPCILPCVLPAIILPGMPRCCYHSSDTSPCVAQHCDYWDYCYYYYYMSEHIIIIIIIIIIFRVIIVFFFYPSYP